MQRRNFLIGAASTAIGGSALVGSGAFSSVEADRTISVEVADDADAYLRLEGAGGVNSDYVTSDGTDGVLEINLDSGNEDIAGDGDGVNPDAVTKIDDLFVVENQGTQEVEITLSKSGENNGLATFHIDDYSTKLDGTSLTAGGSEKISLKIDTEDSGLTGEDEILDSVTFNADEV